MFILPREKGGKNALEFRDFVFSCLLGFLDQIYDRPHPHTNVDLHFVGEMSVQCGAMRVVLFAAIPALALAFAPMPTRWVTGTQIKTMMKNMKKYHSFHLCVHYQLWYHIFVESYILNTIFHGKERYVYWFSKEF